MSFTRLPNESTDNLLSRFLTVRQTAHTQGTGMDLSWECLAWLFLRACGCNNHQLFNILQPYQGRFPSTEAEFNALQVTFRRMGHILEGHTGNIASRLRGPPARQSFAGMITADETHDDRAASSHAFLQQGLDPWTTADGDPWHHSPATRTTSGIEPRATSALSQPYRRTGLPSRR